MKLVTVDRESIFAASLSRVYQHIDKKNVDSWGMITSWREENSLKKNKANFKELKSLVKKYGYFYIRGFGQEEDETGKVKVVEEPTLFIPNIPLEEMRKLQKRYNQYGFIWSGIENKDKIKLYTVKGVFNLGKFHPDKIAMFYSKVKGKRFVFEK